MQLASKVVKHVVAPGYEQARAVPFVEETIQQFLERTEWDFKVPTICVCNGQPILRREWAEYPISMGDITFVSRPHGGSGGGSKLAQVAGIVGMIALAAVAPWAAGALAPILGITSASAISALAAGIVLGGSLLISSVIKWAAGGQSSDTLPDASQVYSLSAAGNSGRPLDVIPVNYGKIKVVPDYASAPWAEYISNDQFLNLPLVIGTGKHVIHQILIDDTILWDEVTGYNTSFVNVEIQDCPPGTSVTLFPTDIQQASEVSGQQLPGPSDPNNGFVGGFIVNAAGTTAFKLVFDIAFPQGLFLTDNDGNPHTTSVNLQIDVRTVDNAGTPTSSWTTIASPTFEDMTRTPQRMSIPIDVASGRYEGRMRRSNEPSGGIGDTVPQQGQGAVIDQVVWLGFRAYIEGPQTFPNEHILAIRMKADAQLSNQSSRQFGVICTRILNVWNGSAFVETATQNPAWAFLDAATNTLYGAGRPLSKIDFQAVYDLAQLAVFRGDDFNYSFRSFVPVPSAFDTILAAVRAKHCWVADILSCVRDQWRPIPSMLLTDHQIVRGSLQVISIFNDETGIDCIIGELLNENTWRPAEIQFPPNGPGFTATNPSRIRINGITDPDQMLREIGFVYRQSQMRRTKVTLSTEHDGRLLRLMSAVKVQSHLPQSWGLGGEVTAKSGLILSLNREFPDLGDTTYIEFRDKRGRYFGPVICHGVSGQPKQTLIDAGDLATVESQIGMTLDTALDRMDGSEPPTFVIGKAGSMSKDCIVLTGRPSGDQVELTLVTDSEAVHDEGAIGTAPSPPVAPLTANPAIPLVTFLTGLFRMGIAEPMIDATWWPAVGAIGYRAQISYNGGVNWTTIYEGIQAGFTGIAVEPAAIKLRVSAYNNIQGPWSVVNIDPPTVEIRYNTVTPQSLVTGLNDYVMKQLKDTNDQIRTIQQYIAANGTDADASAWIDNKSVGRRLTSVTGSMKADINEVIQTATNTETAFASYQLAVSAEFDDVNASVTTVSNAVATLNGYAAASYAVTLNVNNYATGFSLVNGGGGISAFIVVADHFQIQLPGYNGGLPQSIFDVGLVNGVASLGFKGNMYLDGVITARSLAVTTLSSITANIGTITSGVIQSVDGKMVIDLNGRSITISD